MNKRVFLVVGLVALLFAVIGAGAALAQGPQDRPVGRMTEQAFVDADGDGLCDECGQAAQMGGRWTDKRGNADAEALGYGVGRDADWHSVNLLTLVAEELDMSEADVRAALAEGQTFAQVIEANGGSVDSVADAYVAARKAVLDQFVADGRLTQEQADEMLADAQAEILEHLQNTASQGAQGRWGGEIPQRGSMAQGGGRGMRGQGLGTERGMGYNGECPVEPEI